HLAGVAGATRRFLHVALELTLEHVVVVAELLLLVLADAVVAQATAAVAVHARRVQLALAGVLGEVRDRDADAPRELDLGAGVIGHCVRSVALRALMRKGASGGAGSDLRVAATAVR